MEKRVVEDKRVVEGKRVKVKGGKKRARRALTAQKRRENLHRRWFLQHFLEHGRFDEAAAYAGVTVVAVRHWLNKDEEFAWIFEGVKEAFAESLELDVDGCGARGVNQFCFYRGKAIVDRFKQRPIFVRKYSDRLLMFRLRELKPEMYGGRGTA
jgi:hypothetical protein